MNKPLIREVYSGSSRSSIMTHEYGVVKDEEDEE